MNSICCYKCKAENKALFRQNEKGVKGIWVCEQCSDPKVPIDPEVKEISQLISGERK